MCIISDHYEEIRKYIVEKLERGCSIYHLEGGYSGESKVEVVSLLTQNEYASLFNYMKSQGFDGFMTAGNVSEIYGSWHHKGKKDAES